MDTEIKEWLERVANRPEAMQAIMAKHDLKIANHQDPMQKLAFTFYSEIVEMAMFARDVLDGEKGE